MKVSRDPFPLKRKQLPVRRSADALLSEWNREQRGVEYRPRSLFFEARIVRWSAVARGGDERNAAWWGGPRKKSDEGAQCGEMGTRVGWTVEGTN